MYYLIKNGQIEETDKERWLESRNAISIHTVEEWQEESGFRNEFQLNQPVDRIHVSKLESHAEYLFGTLRIPTKNNYTTSRGFSFYIIEGKLIFIDDTGIVNDGINKIVLGKKRKEYTLERFLYDFLVSVIEGDLLYLETIERKISKMEEGVLQGTFDDFNRMMLETKKEIARLYRYYSQLTDVGEELSDNEADFFGKDDVATFNVFTDRAERLQGEAQLLRDYAMQVQEVYRSEINIRQNDVMKVLTIVTTIFLPLTLIAGWYGMNFVYMPELQWKYGYLTVIILSIVVIFGCLWIFKKKKFW